MSYNQVTAEEGPLHWCQRTQLVDAEEAYPAEQPYYINILVSLLKEIWLNVCPP
jgi:hypothetical protein